MAQGLSQARGHLGGLAIGTRASLAGGNARGEGLGSATPCAQGYRTGWPRRGLGCRELTDKGHTEWTEGVAWPGEREVLRLHDEENEEQKEQTMEFAHKRRRHHRSREEIRQLVEIQRSDQ